MTRSTISRSSNTLRSLQSEVNQLFDRLFPAQDGGGRGADQSAWTPRIDVLETDGHYRLRVDLPGVQRDQVTMNVEGTRLTIRGERPADALQDDDSLLRSERTRGRFYRTMSFPEEINPDEATATLKNGVLVVDLPKVTTRQATSIAIS
jgi:HSP20 family protein